jgi:integrase
LVEILKKAQIKRSLKTQDKKEAKSRLPATLADMEAMFAKARSQYADQNGIGMVSELPLDTILNEWFYQQLEVKFNNVEDARIDLKDLEVLISEFKLELADICREMAAPSLHPSVERIASELLLKNGWEPHEAENLSTKPKGHLKRAKVRPDDLEYFRFCRRIMMRLRELVEFSISCIENPLKARESLSMPQAVSRFNQNGPTLNDSSSALKSDSSEYTLEKLGGFFIDEKSADLDGKSLDDHKAAIALFLEYVGSNNLTSDVSRQYVVGFRDLLLKFPKNARKPIYAKGLSLQELITDASKKDRRTLSVPTVNKRIASIYAMLDYSVKEGVLSKNPAAGLRLKNESTEKKREPFSTESLEKILTSPKISKGSSTNPVFRWTILLSLWNGLRLEEALQLKRSDFDKTADGTVWVDIHSKNGNHLKNLNAHRKIPLHPKLLDEGFDEFKAKAKNANQDRLFFMTEKGVSDRYSKKQSTNINRYFQKIGVHDPLHCFHSLRHNFTDAIRATKMPHDIGNAIGGWESLLGDKGTYGSGYTIDVLFSELKKVSYPLP